MTLFVDASALVSIMTGEPEAASLIDRMADDGHLLSSAIAVWETTMAVARKRKCQPAEAFALVELFCHDMDIALAPIGPSESSIAVEAFTRYGKGRHEAKLNMGDCFAYACARTNNAALLYKGDDFARTDLR
ncbi:hypothetical protein ASE73_09055 [Sphingomonas sp. Leaf24]|uniref:type II toxin-antitoxin system VapC family toxin n=1 Tax=unclassified Sphingomonas TaxID=196159 RepID=UPI000701B1E0|nr:MULTISPECIES: type II toxin-antitoxin system VapC family toxin [unclassified Sphingomonas]KQM17132.1 hypothetical protein ASE50_07105 [Sphingomonas sp. Leaf5]KQM76812.1 hypothetical protein ASE70_08615 [Sphingomonas sp. Leaf22]KQM88024.1 hypothetical protein ASE73_09055 [Sphingomonas sp. Leaf24]